MNRPFEMHVHPELRNLIEDKELDVMARQTLNDVDMVINSDDNAFKHTRMLTYKGKNGQPVPVKFVMARGTGFDAIHVTVPRSMDAGAVKCKECDGIGYQNLERSRICTTCQGLGYGHEVPTASL